MTASARMCVCTVRVWINSVLRTQAAVNDGLVAWIMQFGAKVRVKKPDSLKKLLFEKAREIESVYKI